MGFVFQPILNHGQFIKEAKSDAKSIHILFSPNESVGALAESLKIFKVLWFHVIIYVFILF